MVMPSAVKKFNYLLAVAFSCSLSLNEEIMKCLRTMRLPDLAG